MKLCGSFDHASLWSVGDTACYLGFIKVWSIGYVILVAISGTTKLASYHGVKSLQLIWKWGTCRWNLRVPHLQMCCGDSIRMKRYQYSSSSKGCQVAGSVTIPSFHRADSRFAPSQWETSLLCNDISHWLGENLESALILYHCNA